MSPTEPGITINSNPDNGLLFVDTSEDGKSSYHYGYYDSAGFIKPTHVIIYDDNTGDSFLTVFNKNLIPILYVMPNGTISIYKGKDDTYFDPKNAYVMVKMADPAHECEFSVDLSPPKDLQGYREALWMWDYMWEKPSSDYIYNYLTALELAEKGELSNKSSPSAPSVKYNKDLIVKKGMSICGDAYNVETAEAIVDIYSRMQIILGMTSKAGIFAPIINQIVEWIEQGEKDRVKDWNGTYKPAKVMPVIAHAVDMGLTIASTIPEGIVRLALFGIRQGIMPALAQIALRFCHYGLPRGRDYRVFLCMGKGGPHGGCQYTWYGDIQTCIHECKTSMGCFINICGSVDTTRSAVEKLRDKNKLNGLPQPSPPTLMDRFHTAMATAMANMEAGMRERIRELMGWAYMF